MGWGGNVARRGAVAAAGVVVAALSAAGGRAATDAACATAAQTVTCDYSYTGAEQTFTVPSGVHTLQVSAIGAAGGGAAGGAGGEASAAVTVTPGATLYVEVGGTGAAAAGVAGGFNGGGAEGGGPTVGGAGSGGGASDVRTVSCGGSCPGSAASLASRLIVAGGGGGSGAAGPLSALGHGGSADADGTAGRADSAGDTGGGPGLAGLISAGGAFGAGGVAISGGTDGAPGTGGSSGQGGDGGTGGDTTANAAGGGGGGGYNGGGGGGAGAVSTGHQAAGGGGGGGASYAPGGTITTATGPATVTIAYSLPSITITSPQQGAQYLAGNPVPAAYSCAEAAPGTGVTSCAGTVGSGDSIPLGPGSHTFTVTATDAAGNTAGKSVDYSVIGPPSVKISSPAEGITVRTGQIVHTSFSCGEATGGPGITLCQDATGTTSDPAPAASKTGTGLLDTATLGKHTYSVRALSVDGLTGSATIAYSVVGPPTLTGFTITPKPATVERRTELSFALDQRATVRFGIAALLPGTLSAGVCTPLRVAQIRDGFDFTPLTAVNLRLGGTTQLFLPATAPPLRTPADYRPPRWFQTPRFGLPTPPECRIPGRWALIGQTTVGAGQRTVAWNPSIAHRPLPAGPYEVTAQAIAGGAKSQVVTAVLTLDMPAPPRITSLVAVRDPHLPQVVTAPTHHQLTAFFNQPVVPPKQGFTLALAWDDSQQATAVAYVVKQLPGQLVQRNGHELCLPAFKTQWYGHIATILQAIWNSHHGSVPFAQVADLTTPTEPPLNQQGKLIHNAWGCAIFTTRNPVLTHVDVAKAVQRKSTGPSLSNCSLAGLCPAPVTFTPPNNWLVWNGTADGEHAGSGIYDLRVEATNAAGQSGGTDVQTIINRVTRQCGSVGGPGPSDTQACAQLQKVWTLVSGSTLTTATSLPTG